eukprot:536271-Prorocentrum_minimum.AAC.1
MRVGERNNKSNVASFIGGVFTARGVDSQPEGWIHGQRGVNSHILCVVDAYLNTVSKFTACSIKTPWLRTGGGEGGGGGD